MTAPGWREYAADLRALAALVEAHHHDLPLPSWPAGGLTILVDVDDATDVHQAATVLGAVLNGTPAPGQTNTRRDVGTVHVTFSHVAYGSPPDTAGLLRVAAAARILQARADQ